MLRAPGAALCALALALLAAHACHAQRVSKTLTPAPGAQVGGLSLELDAHTATLRNVQLRAASVAAVRLLSAGGGADATDGVGRQLDWEQRFQPGRPGSFEVAAALPAGQRVGRVVVVCEACGAASGALATATLPAKAGSSGAAAATLVFALHGAQPGVAPTDAASAQQRRRRGLRQSVPAAPSGPAALPDCSLQVGDANLSFQGCLSVRVSPSTLYQFYYTLEPSGGGTRWTGGLKVDAAAVGGQWAGFGFPQFPMSMLGTKAAIVKQCPAGTCPSGASVDGYVLVGYTPPDNVPGSFPLTNTSAALAPDGTLVATFTAQLDTPPDQLLSQPFNFVYAVGPTAADGGLLPHPSASRPYGGQAVDLSAGLSAGGGGGPPAAAPTATPSPSAAPGGAGPAAAAPAAAAPAPASEPAAAAPTCELSLGGQSQSFEQCNAVGSVGTDYVMLWTLSPPAAGAANGTLRLGLRAASGGWVALGFPATPGQMLGSTALILKTCPSCASGADINGYLLAARTPAAVQPPGWLVVANASAAAADGAMQGTIEVSLDAASLANPAFPILLAAGPVDSTGGLLYHYQRGASTVDWASGAASGVQGDSSSVKAMKAAHGWLMAIGWGLLIPLGIVTARHGKGAKPPLWFHLHRAMQALGMSCALAAFILIFFAVQDATGTSVSTFTLHRRLGISAMSMGCFQLLALVLRPRPGTRLRKFWEPVHHWVGRAAALVAVANIYEGIINVYHVGTWAVATYSVIFGLIAGTHLGLDAYRLLTGRHLLGAPPAQGGPPAADGASHEGSSAAADGGGAKGSWSDMGKMTAP